MSTRLHTYTGQGFDPLNPRAEDVRIEDIAQALACTCRFGGHTPRFYSVAQHALHVSELVLAHTKSIPAALLALHHDSAEAYVGDICRPLKNSLVFHADHAPLSFDYVETNVLIVIHTALGITPTPEHNAIVSEADNAMLYYEFQGLFKSTPVSLPSQKFTGTNKIHVNTDDCWNPETAKGMFMNWNNYLQTSLKETLA